MSFTDDYSSMKRELKH